MNLPPIFYVKAFYNAVALLLSGLAALLVALGYIPSDYALDAGAILAFILSVLEFFKIEPQLRALKAARKSKK